MADPTPPNPLDVCDEADDPRAARRTSIPGLDHVALVCLLLTCDGRIRWANSAAVVLARSLSCAPVSLEDLVDPQQRPALATLVQRAYREGRAQGVVAMINGALAGAPQHLELVLTPAGTRRSAADGSPAGCWCRAWTSRQ